MVQGYSPLLMLRPNLLKSPITCRVEGGGGGNRPNFQLLMLSPNLLKSKIPYMVGRRGTHNFWCWGPNLLKPQIPYMMGERYSQLLMLSPNLLKSYIPYVEGFPENFLSFWEKYPNTFCSGRKQMVPLHFMILILFNLDSHCIGNFWFEQIWTQHQKLEVKSVPPPPLYRKFWIWADLDSASKIGSGSAVPPSPHHIEKFGFEQIWTQHKKLEVGPASKIGSWVSCAPPPHHIGNFGF